MRITSEKIAQLANVSRSTVSRVINNYPNVPEETRKKVMSVIEEYGYEPNTSARVLAGKNKGEVVLCISDGVEEKRRWGGMKTVYFMRLIADMISESKKYDCIVSVYIVSKESDFIKIEDMYLNREICGGIFIGFEFQMDKINKLIAQGLNMAVIDPADNMLERPNAIGIYSENEMAAYLGTRYLLEKGHRRIAHIRGDDRLSGIHRLLGYQRAMKEAGIEQYDGLILEGGFEWNIAYEKALVALKDRSITAVFAANDKSAIAAMRAAAELGRRVPEDVAVVGCDYVEAYEQLGFRLTSVEVSLREIADASLKAILGINKERSVVCRAKLRIGDTA